MSQPRRERPRELGPYPRSRVDVSQRQVLHNQRLRLFEEVNPWRFATTSTVDAEDADRTSDRTVRGESSPTPSASSTGEEVQPGPAMLEANQVAQIWHLRSSTSIGGGQTDNAVIFVPASMPLLVSYDSAEESDQDAIDDTHMEGQSNTTSVDPSIPVHLASTSSGDTAMDDQTDNYSYVNHQYLDEEDEGENILPHSTPLVFYESLDESEHDTVDGLIAEGQSSISDVSHFEDDTAMVDSIATESINRGPLSFRVAETKTTMEKLETGNKIPTQAKIDLAGLQALNLSRRTIKCMPILSNRKTKAASYADVLSLTNCVQELSHGINTTNELLRGSNIDRFRHSNAPGAGEEGDDGHDGDDEGLMRPRRTTNVRLRGLPRRRGARKNNFAREVRLHTNVTGGYHFYDKTKAIACRAVYSMPLSYLMEYWMLSLSGVFIASFIFNGILDAFIEYWMLSLSGVFIASFIINATTKCPLFETTKCPLFETTKCPLFETTKCPLFSLQNVVIGDMIEGLG
ncbi:uncharacterized protein LACBIDRAFT_330692 [Laccaria bicolor S238N-H82]|uniref:Predicted protein n=1 Tax=Laccaria bicolor (strain S238N-H82 / ATCC MYA-4686) TaxID=486041 RepID=B0DM52_LACBS|nr:uncharacterized protein LACBIDRAFT_330692 [Laccaria bicolor S238N-H82]EDR04412.1 predicted protein [Laccaria bicolor S238N-H82]|eukprot:XP_001884931.1 predicted protein [Laccaria bicolor S238N-H82]